MRFIFCDQTSPWRGPGIGYMENTRIALIQSCGRAINIGANDTLSSLSELIPDDAVPVLLLLNSESALTLVNDRTARKKPFLLVDHGLGKRFEDMRLAVNGIYAPYKAGAPVWNDRPYTWKPHPWRRERPKVILHCPSAADFYGRYLRRDQTHGEFEMEAIIHHLKLMGLIDPAWQVVLRTRFENKWAETHQSVRPGAEEQILNVGAVADGNSAILMQALLLGTPPFIWEHPDKPLANPVVNFLPLTLDKLDYPDNWIYADREAFFAQLAMTQCPNRELAEPVMFRRLVDYQFEHLLAA